MRDETRKIVGRKGVWVLSKLPVAVGVRKSRLEIRGVIICIFYYMHHVRIRLRTCCVIFCRNWKETGKSGEPVLYWCIRDTSSLLFVVSCSSNKILHNAFAIGCEHDAYSTIRNTHTYTHLNTHTNTHSRILRSCTTL